ncbi:unnamed protein product [Larinioides sclopetarius]|uniref:Uncharacterized protein n=1 Tax=Larinioides sclopetarius TaxID=280406 RepID=A0AAV2BDC5_9ARAC
MKFLLYVQCFEIHQLQSEFEGHVTETNIKMAVDEVWCMPNVSQQNESNWNKNPSTENRLQAMLKNK